MIWQATKALRIVRPDISFAFLGQDSWRLQQAWQSDTGTVEWRDVPTVTESEAKKSEPQQEKP